MYSIKLRFKEEKDSQDYIGCLEFDFEFHVNSSRPEEFFTGWYNMAVRNLFKSYIADRV